MVLRSLSFCCGVMFGNLHIDYDAHVGNRMLSNASTLKMLLLIKSSFQHNK